MQSRKEDSMENEKNCVLKRIYLSYRDTQFFDEPQARVTEEYEQKEGYDTKTISLDRGFYTLTEAIEYVETLRKKWKVDGNES